MLYLTLVAIFLLAYGVTYYFMELKMRTRFMKEIAELQDLKEEKIHEAVKEALAEKNGQPGRQPGKTRHEEEFDPSQPRKNHIPYLRSMVEAIGCQLEINSEDNSMSFKYQGEEFIVEYNGVYMRIWDPGWLRIPSDNPSFRDALKAINETNFGFGPTVIYTTPDVSGSVALHSRLDIYFPRFADNDPDFLRHTLNLFFDTKHAFASHIKEMNEKGTSLPNPSLLNPLIPSSN